MMSYVFLEAKYAYLSGDLIQINAYDGKTQKNLQGTS